MKPFLKITKDFSKQLNDAVKSLQDKETLVGIPQDKSPRQEGEISNAEILFINEFGSPKANIPARPVMAIGIKKAQDEIAEEFKKLAQAVLTKGGAAYDAYYERIGMIASGSVKQVINSQEGIEHISFATALARLRAGFKGDKALIVTGQMRNAITYVVRSKSWRK